MACCLVICDSSDSCFSRLSTCRLASATLRAVASFMRASLSSSFSFSRHTMRSSYALTFTSRFFTSSVMVRKYAFACAIWPSRLCACLSIVARSFWHSWWLAFSVLRRSAHFSISSFIAFSAVFSLSLSASSSFISVSCAVKNSLYPVTASFSSAMLFSSFSTCFICSLKAAMSSSFCTRCIFRSAISVRASVCSSFSRTRSFWQILSSVSMVCTASFITSSVSLRESFSTCSSSRSRWHFSRSVLVSVYPALTAFNSFVTSSSWCDISLWAFMLASMMALFSATLSRAAFSSRLFSASSSLVSVHFWKLCNSCSPRVCSPLLWTACSSSFSFFSSSRRLSYSAIFPAVAFSRALYSTISLWRSFVCSALSAAISASCSLRIAALSSALCLAVSASKRIITLASCPACVDLSFSWAAAIRCSHSATALWSMAAYF
mmetsp:Transcript_38081/g.82796  ORF Transcript_38081/g.82796 Transcript_38081/m.82796 type:complete len:435 (+) Transcript_38081:387-1691(+)